MGELHAGAQQLGYAPRLRDAAARREWRLGIEHLADRSDARIVHVREETVDTLLDGLEVVGMDLQPGVDERTDEPSPDRALVIGRVARAQIAEVARLVVGIAGRE